MTLDATHAARRRAERLRRLVAAAAIALAACGPRVARIEIRPTKAQFLVHGGAPLVIEAVPLDAQGKPVSGVTLVWRSRTTACGTACEDWDIVSVDSTGRVTPHQNGRADVEVSAGGAMAKCAVTVAMPAAIFLTGENVQRATGLPVHLTVVAKDEDGRFLPDAPLQWSSSDPRVAAVDGRGDVVPAAPGKAVITVQNGDLQSKMEVRVEPLDFDGLAPGLSAEMASALVDLGRDLGAPLRVSVRSNGGDSSHGAVADLRLALAPGQERPLGAYAIKDGKPVAQVAARWTSASPAIVSVTSDGHVTARAPGETVLTASFGGISATLPATVSVRRDLEPPAR